MSIIKEYKKHDKRYLVEWSGAANYWHEEGSFHTLFRAKICARFQRSLGYNARITDQRAVKPSKAEPLTDKRFSGTLKGLITLKEKK